VNCWLVLLCSVAALGLSTVVADRVAINARATPHPRPRPRSSESPVWTHQEIVISAVTPASVTVEDRTVSNQGMVLNKTNKTYLVSQFTEVTVNGQRATIADLKPGMKATVTIGTDPTKAARIVASG
jgi:hypothetical protein